MNHFQVTATPDGRIILTYYVNGVKQSAIHLPRDIALNLVDDILLAASQDNHGTSTV